MSLVRGSRACGCGDLARGGRQDKCLFGFAWWTEGGFIRGFSWYNAKRQNSSGLGKNQTQAQALWQCSSIHASRKVCTTMAVALSTRLRIVLQYDLCQGYLRTTEIPMNQIWRRRLLCWRLCRGNNKQSCACCGTALGTLSSGIGCWHGHCQLQW
jgi:hypothetical protein